MLWSSIAQSTLDAVPSLLIAILQIPIFGFATLSIIKMMLDRQLGFLSGITAFAALIACLAITVTSRNLAVSAAVLIALVSLMAFFPFAEDQIERIHLRGIDVDQLDKAYESVSQNPQNIPARFRLAEGVYRHGLAAHAIAIGDETLQLLDTMRDPLKNMSMRDAYRSEEAMIKQWKRAGVPANAQRLLSCPRCGKENPFGSIACVSCRGPYLLDIAQKGDLRTKIMPRLVMGWALVGLLIAGIAGAALNFKGVIVGVAIGIGVALVGVIMWQIFRPPRLI